jgi:hypothetical protein
MMSTATPAARRVEPSAWLIPPAGHHGHTLDYVRADKTDLRASFEAWHRRRVLGLPDSTPIAHRSPRP